ncbi:MAG TPA: hypothetical protein VFR85_15205 [Anaeromyxobacteraceae bacterium]|nr:hypothetical protein [Anaeromyxobacteraceae bacterium]
MNGAPPGADRTGTGADEGREGRGRRLERIAVGLLSVATGVVLVYLAVKGPLWLGHIRYKTAPVIDNQVVGQDLVNLFLLAPISIAGGMALLLGKGFAKYLLVLTPLYLVYYALSYTIGWEWSSPRYGGNSQRYTFHFLLVLVSALLTLLYCLSALPRARRARFGKWGLAVYSAVLGALLLVFAGMWIGEVREVMATGTTRGYDLAPTAFWLVRVFDLGFSIPLGLLSIYLLWARPEGSFAIQLVFYGFFGTMIVAVNAMGLFMLARGDPTFLWRDLAVFLALGATIFAGFGYVIRGYRAG